MATPPPSRAHRPRSIWQVPGAILLFFAAGGISVRYNAAIPSGLTQPILFFVIAFTALMLGGWLLGQRQWPAVFRKLAALPFFVALVIFGGIGTRRVLHYRPLTARVYAGHFGPAEPPVPELPHPPDPVVPLEILTGPDLLPVDLSHSTPQDFPKFLGPDGNNRLENVHLNPDWVAHPPRELWRHHSGRGWSGFAVVNGFAVTMEQRGDVEKTICYELATGRARWVHDDVCRLYDNQGGDGPRATPTIDSGQVFTEGGTGILNCLDGATGRLIWTRNVIADAGTSHLTFGQSCSPLVTDGLVIVTGGNSGPTALAYRRQSGEPAWRAGDGASCYASPVLATLCGVRQIITVGPNTVSSNAPIDGHELWTYDWSSNPYKIPQPMVFGNNQILLDCGYGIGAESIKLTPGPAGTLTPAFAWKAPYLKARYSNNVVRGSFVFGLDEGVLTCLDISNGHKKWRGESYGYGQLLGVDDLLLIISVQGNLALVRASSDSFTELARLENVLGSNPESVSGSAPGAPTLAGHLLLLRNNSQAVCYELP